MTVHDWRGELFNLVPDAPLKPNQTLTAVALVKVPPMPNAEWPAEIWQGDWPGDAEPYFLVAAALYDLGWMWIALEPWAMEYTKRELLEWIKAKKVRWGQWCYLLITDLGPVQTMVQGNA